MRRRLGVLPAPLLALAAGVTAAAPSGPVASGSPAGPAGLGAGTGAAATAVTAAAAAASPAFWGEERLALVIGHNQGGAGTRPLRYAQDDARKVAGILAELGGFRADGIRVLLAPGPAAVRKALAEMEERVASLRRLGRRVLLLIYYSGHASDGQMRLGEDRFPLEEVRQAAASSRADVRLVFLDACQSGAITRPKGARSVPLVEVNATGVGPAAGAFLEPATEPSPVSGRGGTATRGQEETATAARVRSPEDRQEGPRGYVIVTSSAADELSHESDDVRGSLFSHHLVSGLRGAADREGDGRVTLAEAYNYAYGHTVYGTLGAISGTQHPTYLYDLRGTGQVVLTELAGGGILEFPRGTAADGSSLVYDLGRDLVVAEVSGDARDGVRLRVAPGRYAVRRRTGERLLLQEVHVAAGQTVTVRESDFRVIRLEDDVTKGPAFLARVRKTRTRIGVSGGLGVQVYFDEPARGNLFHPVTLAGVGLSLANLVAPGVSLHLDVAGGRREAGIEDYDALGATVSYSALEVGVGATWDGWLGERVRVGTGPRFALLYYRREFLEPADLPFQDLAVFSPGWVAGATLDAWKWLEVGAEVRVNYMHYATAEEDLSLGFGEFFLSLGRREW